MTKRCVYTRQDSSFSRVFVVIAPGRRTFVKPSTLRHAKPLVPWLDDEKYVQDENWITGMCTMFSHWHYGFLRLHKWRCFQTIVNPCVPVDLPGLCQMVCCVWHGIIVFSQIIDPGLILFDSFKQGSLKSFKQWKQDDWTYLRMHGAGYWYVFDVNCFKVQHITYNPTHPDFILRDFYTRWTCPHSS